MEHLTSDALTWADGYGHWHAEADNRDEALAAIVAELRLRGETAPDLPTIVGHYLQPCTVATSERGVWCENPQH